MSGLMIAGIFLTLMGSFIIIGAFAMMLDTFRSRKFDVLEKYRRHTRMLVPLGLGIALSLVGGACFVFNTYSSII